MRPRPFLLLLAGFVLVLMAAGDADAMGPVWSYTAGSAVNSVSISADGEYIAAGSNNDKVYLFDKDSSTPLWNYTAESNVYSVAISADGEYIAAGSYDGKVYLFDKDSSTPPWSYDTGANGATVAISADGEYIAAGSSWPDEKVYLFDKDSSTPLWNFTTGGAVDRVAISADGEYIAAGSRDDKVYLFDKDSSSPLWSYSTRGDVRSVAISADGEYVVAGSYDKVYIFDKDSSTPLWNYTMAGDNVNSVVLSADGEYIVAGGGGNNNGKVCLFDKNSSTPLWTFGVDTEAVQNVHSVSISADGEYITAGTVNSMVYRFDKDSSMPLWNYTAVGPIGSVAISADGEYIAAGSNAYNVYLLDENIPPTATIDSISPLSARDDAEVTFSGSGSDSDGTVVAYEWASSRDGFLSDEKDFSTTGLSIGYHYITLRVQDNHGDWSRGWFYWDSPSEGVWLLIYQDAPTATIDSITPSPARFDAEVTFSGSGSDSDGTVVAYEWTSSRDGFLSDEEEFSITGLTVGTHNITFRVKDDDGKWSEWNATMLVINPNVLPVATIDSITPSSARFDAEVTFNGTGSDSDGTVVAYEWNSDIDGFLSEEEGFSIAGFSVGNHTLSFRVQDNDGNWSYWSTSELYVYPNTPPAGTIYSIEPSPAEKGTIVSFNGTGSDDNGTVVAYLWESSIDRELSTEANFSSNTLSFGHHTITFQVQDNDGAWSNTRSESLFVFAYPVAIAGQDSTGTSGVPLQFSGAGTDEDGTIANYEWDFDGDGIYEYSSSTSVDWNSNYGSTSYTYSLEGNYTAVLRVTDNDGFTSTDTVDIAMDKALPPPDDEVLTPESTDDDDALTPESTDDDGALTPESVDGSPGFSTDSLYILGTLAVAIVTSGALIYIRSWKRRARKTDPFGDNLR